MISDSSSPHLTAADNATSADLAQAFQRWFYLASHHAINEHTARLAATALSPERSGMDLSRLAYEHLDADEFYEIVRPWFLRTARNIMPEPYWSQNASFQQGTFRSLHTVLSGVERNPVLTRHLRICILRSLKIFPHPSI